jgi:hypothetical protein
VIALASVISNEAFPLYIDDTLSPIIDDSYVTRREIFDPYGFNSILTRLIERDRLYDALRKRTVHFINRDEDDFI